MSKIVELRAKAKKLEEDAAVILNGITDKTPADEVRAANEKFDAMMDQRDDLVSQAAREERAENARKDAEERQEREDREQRDREGRRPGMAGGEHTPNGDVSDEYREAFRQFLASGGNAADMDQEARAVLRAGVQEYRTQTVGGNGTQGGHLVPTTLANTINIAMALHGPMMDPGVATEINLANGAPFDLPKVDDTENDADAHTEGDEPANDDSGDIVLGKTQLGAYTMITPWIIWSYELAQDTAFGYETLLGNLLGERLGRKGNAWLTTGTGTGQPLGFVTGAGVGHTAAATGAMTFDDIIELEHSVDPAYRAGPMVRYQMHDQTVKLLRKIKDSNGRYVWSDGDVTKGIAPQLNGKPVSLNQAMAQVGASAKTIAFGDFSQYYKRVVGAPLIGVAREKYWPNIGIAGVHRIDGSIAHARAIKTLQMAAA